MSIMDGLKDSVAFQKVMDKVEEKMQENLSVVKGSGDTYEIFRSQGAINALEFVRDLPDIIKTEDEGEKKNKEDDEFEGEY